MKTIAELERAIAWIKKNRHEQSQQVANIWNVRLEGLENHLKDRQFLSDSIAASVAGCKNVVRNWDALGELWLTITKVHHKKHPHPELVKCNRCLIVFGNHWVSLFNDGKICNSVPPEQKCEGCKRLLKFKKERLE